ncbi:MAG: DNA-directed RNA polymerase subunit D [Candidatus Thermoplasmatota archaeon]
MEIKVVELTSEVGVFAVKGTTPSILNAIRRTMLSQVPKLAIEDVTIYDNTSALFDEMIAHRLGLLPVPTDLNAFNRRWKDNNANPKEASCACNGEGCASCTVLFTLSKEGPCMVLSGDLVPAGDAKFKIVDPKIPIVKLLDGQRVMLETGAILGTGLEHGKWQAVNAAGYMEYPTVKLGNHAVPQATIEKMQRTAPPGAFTFENNGFRVTDVQKAAAYLPSAKKLYAPDLDHVEIGSEAGHWLFRVETDGSLRPDVAIRKAISIVMEKLKEVESESTKLKPYEAPTA